MMPGEALPWGVRQYLPIFTIIYVFTLMAGAAALSGIAHALPLRLDTVGVEYVAGIGLAFFISIQSFFVLRAHPQALRMLIILLLVFFGCAFLTYNMSIKPMLALMAWLPSLIALWLLKTRRFRGLWKRLCVMRRRRTRYRRLIRQLKRTQALDDLITAFSLEMHSRVTRERAVWPIKQRQVYSRLMRSSPGASEALILEQTKNRRMSGGELLGLYRIHRYMGHQGFHTLRALQVTAGVCLLSSSDRMLDETLTI